jgi:hypothetical protein
MPPWPPGTACTPADESGFVPKWHPPAPRQAACTQAQIDAFHACLKTSSPNDPACAPFQGTNETPANKACAACIQTPDSAANYGPLIAHAGSVELNIAGCLAEATSDPNGTGCAGKYQASTQCLSSACLPNCPIADTASFTAEQSCESAAAAGTCTPFADAAKCTNALSEAGGAAAQCLGGQTFDDAFNAIVPIFCLGGDGG